MLKRDLKIWIARSLLSLSLLTTACGITGKSPESLQPGENIAETPNLITNNATPPVITTCSANFEVTFSGPLQFYRTGAALPPAAWFVGGENATFEINSGDCTLGAETMPVSFWAGGEMNASGLPELGVNFGAASLRGTISASNFSVVGSEVVHGFLDNFEFNLNPLCDGRGTFHVDYENNTLTASGALYLTFKAAEAKAQGITTGIRENCSFWNHL